MMLPKFPTHTPNRIISNRPNSEEFTEPCPAWDDTPFLRTSLAGAFIAVGHGGGSRTAPTDFDKMSRWWR